jgi:hypothetical protein
VIRILAAAAILVGIPALALADPEAALAPHPSVLSADAGNATVAQAAAAPSPVASPAAMASSAPAVTASPMAAATSTPEPPRRPSMGDAPMDSLFPNPDFGGPLIGTNIDPVGFPLETLLKNTTDFGKFLDQTRTRIYGWINPGVELTNSSALNTFPISYNPVANHLELDQAVVRLERDPDTVQQDHADWGFRFSAIYGVDYRWTSAYGFTSDQLAAKNQLNGFDLPEAFFMLYEPHFFAGGTVIELGRVISVPDIEAQLAPQNYLYTHSIMFDWDSYTQTGLLFWSKLSNMFTIDYGITWGDDVFPGNPTVQFPTGQFFVKYTDKSNRNDLLIGVDAYNNRQFSYYLSKPINAAEAAVCANYNPALQYTLGQSGTVYTGVPAGQCLYGHDNLQQFNMTFYHTFNKVFHNAFETYYLWTRNAPEAGSISNGPLQFSAGGGAGAFIPGRATAIGMVDYLEWKFSPTDFASFRTDYLNDPQGWRTGYQTSYGSITLGVTHHFTPLTWIRPELRVEKAFSQAYNAGSSNYVGYGPYDNLEGSSGYVGTKSYQTTLGIDLIQWF